MESFVECVAMKKIIRSQIRLVSGVALRIRRWGYQRAVKPVSRMLRPTVGAVSLLLSEPLPMDTPGCAYSMVELSIQASSHLYWWY